jgi:hypothetical protein
VSEKNIDKFISNEDRKKIRERKERIQHPHMIKSRSHWDWDMGYDCVNDLREDDEKSKKS